MRKINKEQANERLGDIGEKIIANFLSSQGKKIELSLDKFDKYKDMLVDGQIVEVKTETPFVSECAFTIAPNQLAKCKNADHFYVVTSQWPGRPSSFDFKIYKVRNDFKHKTYITRKHGKTMVLIPIRQAAVSFVKDLTEYEAKALAKYTITDY